MSSKAVKDPNLRIQCLTGSRQHIDNRVILEAIRTERLSVNVRLDLTCLVVIDRRLRSPCLERFACSTPPRISRLAFAAQPLGSTTTFIFVDQGHCRLLLFPAF